MVRNNMTTKENCFMKTNKPTALLLCLLLAGSTGLAATPACAAEAQDPAASEISATVGGWEVNAGSLAPADNAAALAALTQATDQMVGCDYTPIAYLGSQVVAGTNYSFLCRLTPVVLDAPTALSLVTVYEDLEGNAQITQVTDLAASPEEGTDGAWLVNEGDTALSANPQVQQAFDQALDGLVGADYEPVAFLASQVVAGSNYQVLCRTTPVVPDAQPSLSLVTVTANLDGTASLADVTDLDLSAYPTDDVAWPQEGSGNTEAVATDGQEAAQDPELIGMADPFTQVNSMSEAAQRAGFSLTLPAGQTNSTIRVMDKSMIEVIANDAQGKETYRVRKAVGSDDISGDYTNYTDLSLTRLTPADGTIVTLRGEKGLWSVISWTKDGYSYAIDAQDQPLTDAQAQALIQAVR